MSYSYSTLMDMTREEVVAAYDKMAANTQIGLNYYTDELRRRDFEHHNRVITKLTWAMAAMTAAVLIATIVNVVLFALD